MRWFKLFAVIALLALVLSTVPSVARAEGPAGKAPPPPITLTPELAQRSIRLIKTGQQVLPKALVTGGTSYWFSVTGSWGTPNISDYSSWNIYKINGSTTNFYVELVGSAYETRWDWSLTRFEPWMRANTSSARLNDWRPNAQVQVSGQTTMTFSLAYQGTGLSTTFTPAADTYNPYVTSTMYSSEWRGWKWPGDTAGNNWVTRWSGGQPYGMQFANCGRETTWWGNCSNR